MEKKLKQFEKLKEEIYEYFKFIETWKERPISIETDCYWKLYKNESVEFCPNKKFMPDSTYGYDIVHDSVYIGEDYTMIVSDTHCDGNEYDVIFSNKLQIK